MKKFLLFSFIASLPFIGISQTALTQYNMRYLQQASFNNPAFTPTCKVTVGGILFGSTTASYGNTGISRRTIGQLSQGRDGVIDALNSMNDLNYMDLDFRRDLIHFGFRLKEKHYLSFNASVRSNTTISYPRDFMTLIFLGNGISADDPGVSGVPEDYMLLGQRANFDGTGVESSTYAEFGLQYAVKLLPNERLSLGVRPKLLFGMANVNTALSELGLTTDEESFALTMDGSYLVNTSLPIGEDTAFAFPGFVNRGFGVDLGASFNINDHIQVSGSVVDLGSISWNFRPENYTASDGELMFNGFPLDGSILEIGESMDTLLDGFAQSMLDSLNSQFGADTTNQSYNTRLMTQYNLAANFYFKEVHNIGVLLNARSGKNGLRPAFTLSYGYQIDNKFSLHANYSIYNRSFVNLGVGGSAQFGPFQLYVMSDNILASIYGGLLPISTKNRHVSGGLNWKFGCVDDRDKDGIKDKDDDCPDTPGDLKFKGCPDTDKDGIPDKEDMCPETPGSKEFQGCPDRDGDGIVDSEDDCPDSPGVAEFNGCPDTDGDGIKDAEDACPTTAGVAEFNGCPDTDADGIQDSEDDCPKEAGIAEFNGCPDTDEDGIMDSEDDCPEEAGIAEFNGCPDTDGDGIMDSKDACPEKAGPKEFKGCPDTDGDGLSDIEDKCPEIAGPMDNNGCPYGDRDGDGVIDKEDGCPDVAGPAENKGCPYSDLDQDGVLDKDDRCIDVAGPVENNGCPYSDIDGDGVLDKDDRCPQTPGVASNEGCPEIKEEEQEVLNTAFDNLEFETSKAVIRESSYESLDRLAELLVDKPDWRLEIEGHTDNVGSDAANMNLSENRAKSVANYLESKGVAKSRLVVKWFGETKPITSNDTPEGRARNRRVEMNVIFD